MAAEAFGGAKAGDMACEHQGCGSIGLLTVWRILKH